MARAHGFYSLTQMRRGQGRAWVVAAKPRGSLRLARDTGVQDNHKITMLPACPVCEGKAVVVASQTGIGKEHIDRRAMLKDRFCFEAIGRFNDAEAAIAQVFGNSDAHEHIIINQEHRGAGIADMCWGHDSNLDSGVHIQNEAGDATVPTFTQGRPPF